MKVRYDPEVLRELCEAHGVARLELFGSALRDDFRPDSDVDVLCTLLPNSRCTLLGWAAIRVKLEEVFGRRVDLVSRPAFERSRNPHRREAILGTATPIYVAG